MTKFVVQAGIFEDNAATTVIVNNTLKTVVIEVPAGRRWTLMGFGMHNPDNVARVVTIRWSDNTPSRIVDIFSLSLTATTRVYGPNASVATLVQKPIVFDGGHKIELVWAAGGASAGGTASYSLAIYEVLSDRAV